MRNFSAHFDINPEKSFVDIVKEKYPEFKPEKYTFHTQDNRFFVELKNIKFTATDVKSDIIPRIVANKHKFAMDIPWQYVHGQELVVSDNDFIQSLYAGDEPFEISIEAHGGKKPNSANIKMVIYHEDYRFNKSKVIATIPMITIENLKITEREITGVFTSPFGDVPQTLVGVDVTGDVTWLL